MATPDRILPLCDLLLGAAHADDRFDDRERETVRELLGDLSPGGLTPEIEARLAAFDPKRFDLKATAREFAGDSIDDRRRLMFLVAAIHESDEELDLAEDDFLRELATALAMPADALAGLTVDVEVEEQRENLQRVRKGPPPPPRKASESVDVDLD
jgi:hypothetical protein